MYITFVTKNKNFFMLRFEIIFCKHFYQEVDALGKILLSSNKAQILLLTIKLL